MADVVQLVRTRSQASIETERALEAMLADVRSGRPDSPHSVVTIGMDSRGHEYIVITGAYRQRGNATNAGFKLQAMAADSTFG